MAKQQLKISRWDVVTRKTTSETFEAMINPAGYTLTNTMEMRPGGKAKGRERATLKLKKLYLDGTGVVPSGAGSPKTVKQQIDALREITSARMEKRKVVYPVVEVTWGTLSYLGRVTALETEYTLFAPDGRPVRAEVSLTLIEFHEGQVQQVANQSTEAMVAQVTAQAGDRLPELAFKAYQDPRMAQALGRFNDLTSIRNVPPGTTLALPSGG